MPRLVNVREDNTRVLFDTAVLEPGDRERFFYAPDRIGQDDLCNMIVAGTLPGGHELYVMAVGLRVLGTAREEEDCVLDHITASLVVHDKIVTGSLPGHVCSTLRYINEEDEEDPTRNPKAFVPGFVFLKPVKISERTIFYLTVKAAKSLPEPRRVRAMLFGLRTWDVQ